MSAPATEPQKQIPDMAASEAAAIESGPQNNGSAKEAELFNSGLSQEEIERLARQGEHRRSEKFKDQFERVAICTLWIVALIALVVGFTWLWHLLLPDWLHWLSPEGVQRLQNIVTGGIVASLAAGHIKKRLGQ